MIIVLNNPYRITGLLASSTAKEQERQIKRLKQFVEAEQEPESDFSFPYLGELKRTSESVSNAASKLNLDSDKMIAALFWFYKGNPITDEPAFDALKNGDLSEAINIWTKLTSTGSVSKRSASAYNNLATLYLSGVLEGTDNKEVILSKGVSLKLKLLESDFVYDFKSITADETYKTTKKELQLLFLNNMQAEIEKSGVTTTTIFLQVLSKLEFSAKEDFFKICIQKPIEQIEKKIANSQSKRKASKTNAAVAGNELYESVIDDLILFKNGLKASNLKLSSISDKVSDEILQCGIDYFSHYQDSNLDPSVSAMNLFKKAKIIAVGNIAIQRCKENTKNLQEWIDNKPIREKQKLVSNEIDFVNSKLAKFQNYSNSITNVNDLVNTCKLRLTNIKDTLGSADEFYLKLSTAVAANALGMLVSVVNEAQNTLKVKNGNFAELHLVLKSAIETSRIIGTLDMLAEQKLHYSNNHSTLNSISAQILLRTLPSSSSKAIDNTYATKSDINQDYTKTEENKKSYIFYAICIVAIIALLEIAIFETFWVLGLTIYLIISILRRN